MVHRFPVLTTARRASKAAHRLSSPSRSWRAGRSRHRHRSRGIVTSSVAPSADCFIERPELMVLAESPLYRSSWGESLESFFPSNGLHFSSIDIATSSREGSSGLHAGKGKKGKGRPAGGVVTLESLEENLASDLSSLGEAANEEWEDELYAPGHAPQTTNSAYSVLIARGPVQCLVAQYFLESLPLAGLVLVDPLLLPVDGRKGAKRDDTSTKKGGETMRWDSEGPSTRWESSLSDLVSMLEHAPPRMYSGSRAARSTNGVPPPLLLPDGMYFQSFESTKQEQQSALAKEVSFLHSLANDGSKKSRPLKLEPGSVPVLAMYSGDHDYHDHYRVCAERTAAFHTCGGKGDQYDQVSVLKIPKKADGAADDDLDRTMMTIYEWYDEVVA